MKKIAVLLSFAIIISMLLSSCTQAEQTEACACRITISGLASSWAQYNGTYFLKDAENENNEDEPEYYRIYSDPYCRKLVTGPAGDYSLAINMKDNQPDSIELICETVSFTSKPTLHTEPVDSSHSKASFTAGTILEASENGITVKLEFTKDINLICWKNSLFL